MKNYNDWTEAQFNYLNISCMRVIYWVSTKRHKQMLKRSNRSQGLAK